MASVRRMTQAPLDLLTRTVRAAVQAEGLRAFSERTRIPLGVVRGALRGQNLTAASIAMLAEALGFVFYVGPPLAGAAPGGTPAAAPGLAEEAAIFRMMPAAPGGWARLDRPAPAGPFFLRRDTGADEAGAEPYCLVDPAAELVPERPVYLEDREGRSAIGRFLGTDPATGWIRVLRHGAAMVDERAPGALRRVAAVTWTGRTPPSAELAGAAVPRRRPSRQDVDAALAELRARLLQMLG